MRDPTGPAVSGTSSRVTPPIRGRAAELEVVHDLISGVARGRAGVLVIEGPPGIGKSRLLTELMEHARQSGVRALFGESFEYQQAVPFFPLFTATLHADPPVGDAEALRAQGLSGDVRSWVANQLRAAIERAAAETPLAIVLEDLHWADDATADDSLLKVADKAHGNPFLLQELVRGLDEDDRLTVGAGRVGVTGDELPRRMALHMRQRLDRLSDNAREVVRVASALPDRFSPELLAAMLQRAPASLVPAVGEAVRADLLVEADDQLKFCHDLLREATRRSLPRSLLRAMERQSAANLLEMGAAPEEVATQLARSAEAGDRPGIEVLRRAAASVARGDPGAAAELSRRALELLPDQDSGRGQLVAETVVFLNQAGRYDEAQQLAGSTLSSEVSHEGEAHIRLRAASGTEAPQQRFEENQRRRDSLAVDACVRRPSR